MKKNRSLLAKIWVVVLITFLVLGGISYFSYRSYERFDAALDEIGAVPESAALTEKLFSRLSALETSSRAYALTLNDEDYGEYFLKAQEAQLYIDSLALRSTNKSYRAQVDTLRLLFREKLNSFDALINYKLAERSSEKRQPLTYLTAQEEGFGLDTLLVPNKTIETRSIPDTTEKPNFFQRLFGKKPGNTITTQTIVTYDTVYKERVDTLLQSVKQAIEEAEQHRSNQLKVLTNRELALINKDQVVVNRLRKLMRSISEKEAFETKMQKEKATGEARASFRGVVFLASVGGILTLVLIFFVVRDIAEARRLQNQLAKAKQKAEELGKAKEDFLASMSHEIRTPLNAIIGFSEQLEKGETEEGTKEKLALIRQSSNHLLLLVNDILDFSKIEAGKLKLENIGFIPLRLAEESLESIRPLAAQKELVLAVKANKSLEQVCVQGDPVRLKQVLLNLLSNAVKFTDRGSILLRIEGEEHLGQWLLRFYVNDTGKGIAKEKIQRIFEGFSQEDSSITRTFGGTGLGLSISNRILALHGAKLQVESEPGKGSVFWFEIAYPKAEEDEYGQAVTHEEEFFPLRGKRLLLIDDDRMNHLLLTDYFKKEGIEATHCYAGKEGIAHACRTRYDFILADLQMPGISGYEVIEEIRRSGSASKNSFVALCTANALVKQQAHPSLEKVDAVLLKPFREKELSAILGKAVIYHKALPNPDGSRAYDLGNFRAFASGDEELVKDFVLSFIESARESIEKMKEAVGREEYQALQAEAHKLANTYGQLKATRLVGELKHLEGIEKNGMQKTEVVTRLKKFEEGSQILFSHLALEMGIDYTSNP